MYTFFTLIKLHSELLNMQAQVWSMVYSENSYSNLFDLFGKYSKKIKFYIISFVFMSYYYKSFSDVVIIL
jgi:hypothetical protein